MKLRGITLTIKKNPFNCDGRGIHQIEYEPGKSISDYCAPFAEPEVDFVYGLNGKVVDGDAVPIDGDFITICPVVGKNILNTILTVGLMVFTGGLFPAGSAFGAFGIKAGTFLAGVVQASVMMIGGALINMLCPPQTADTTIDIKQSDPLYTWGNIDSQTEQGGALAKTYGTMKTSGTILSRHVTTDGKNQYLNILLTGGEGPIDSISDIRINDNPIGNYDGVVVETRLGTNDQTVIANFNDSYADEGLAYELELSGGYSTQLTGGNATQGIEVTLECSNGLYYMNDDSSLAAASVTYQLQYRLAGGAWQDWGTYTISGAESTAVRSVKRLDNLTPGQYEVRAQCTAKSGTSTRYSTRLFWTQVTTIIYDDFVRPGKTLVGIKALATSQLSGSSINVTWLQTRSTVNVWNGSTYVKKPATNPAWVAYDMLHGCRELKNIHTGLIENVVGNVAASRFIYSDFEAWADHCDSLGLSFNHIFTEAADLWDALKIPELFGRGKVIQRGTKFGCTCDKPGIPVQLFTVGNIANESYSKDILPITDRANAVEISFVNAAKNYTKDTFVVYSSDYDTEGVIKSPTQITLAGCTSYEKAYQHGKYLLRVNKLILRTITLKADIDAIGCQYGDQVLVQHDVPRWGEGGRIQEATTLTLKLDRKVVMVSGESYGVIVRLSDDTLVTKTVITQPGETDTITVASAFESVPQEQDLYSFGLINKIAKPFIVIDVDRDDDKRATISAIEYVEAVYEESLDAPVINYGDYAVKPLAISVAETYPRPAGGNANLSVSWIWPRSSQIAKAKIYAGRSLSSLKEQKTVNVGDLIGTSINVTANGTWVVKVVVTDAWGGLTIAAGTASCTIDTILPPDVSSVYVEHLANGRKRIQWGYTYPVPNDVVGFRIKLQAGRLPYWGNAQSIFDGVISQSPWETDAIRSGVYTVMVKAVDASGNESANHAYCLFNVGDELVENVLQTVDYKSSGWLGTKTNCSVNVDGELEANDPGDRMFSDRIAPMFTDRSQPMFTAQYGDMVYEDSFISATSGNLLVQVGCDGTAEVEYRVRGPNPMFTNRASPMFSARDLPMFTPGTYLPYTSKVVIPKGRIDVKATITGARLKPTMHHLTAIVDVEDETEALNDVALSSAGTRLAITKKYHSIKNISATIQFTGTGAQSIQTLDKDAVLGPLVKPFNASGVAVDAVADITIQGIKFVE